MASFLVSPKLLALTEMLEKDNENDEKPRNTRSISMYSLFQIAFFMAIFVGYIFDDWKLYWTNHIESYLEK